MKKYFITGIVILLPVGLTLAIVAFIFNLLTDPFVGGVKAVLDYYGLFERGFLFLSAADLQRYTSQLIIILLLFSFTLLLGAVARWFFINFLIHTWDAIINRIPFVSAIYKTSQDVIKTIFTSKTNSFKQVVMVRFPNAETYTIGLLTNENVPGLEQAGRGDLVSIFVPTTPNPTSGFLMLFKREDLVYLDMKIEDAFKFIISCGVITTPFSVPKKNIETSLPQMTEFYNAENH